MFWRVLALLLIGGVLRGGPGDPLPPRPAVTFFGEGSGLPSVAVQDLEQDARGRVWVGTQRGLAWNHGGHFQALAGPQGMPDILVSRLLAQGDTLWVGTAGSGLLRWRGGVWQRLEAPAGAPLRRVTELRLGADGVVHALILGGHLVKVEGEALVPVAEGPPGMPTTLLPLPRGWMVGTSEGLWIREGQQWARTGPARGVLSLARDAATGDCFVGTQSGAWLNQGGRWIPLRELRDERIIQAEAGPGFRGPAFWLVSRRNLYCLEGGRLFRIPLGTGEDSPQLQSLRLTRSQGRVQVWVASLSGLYRFQVGGWDRLAPGMGPGNTLAFAIQEARDGSLWFGDNRGRVHRLQGGLWRTWEAGAVAGDASITSLAELPQAPGQWLAYNARGGFTHFDGLRWRPVGWGELPETWGSWAGLAAGSREGRPGIWVAHEGGLGFWEPGRPVRRIADIPRGARWLLVDPARTDRLVVGGFDGLLRLWEDGKLRVLADLKQAQFGVCGAWVRGQEGRQLRVGTYAGGVVTLDTAGRVLAIWDPDRVPGWPSKVILSVAVDEAGQTWVGTDHGMALVTQDGRLLSTSTREDGLPADLCTHLALLVDRSGAVWTSTARGVARLARPIPPSEPLPAVHLQTSESQAGPFGAGAVLAHPARRVRITFDLPVQHREGDVRFQTQLEGLDTQPTPWTREASAEFPTLPPGTYRFVVWARDGHGVVSTSASLAFRVAAPWWRHPLMVLLYLSGLAGGGLAFHRVRVHRLKAHNAELAAKVAQATTQLREANDRLYHLNDEKNRIIGVAAHDLRNPLSGILLSVELLQEEAREDQAVDLARIRDLGLGMNHILHELLDVNAIEADASEAPRQEALACGAIWPDLLDLHLMRAARKDIALQVEAGAPDLLVLADARHLHRVLDNLVSNAIKYSPPGRRVWLRTRPQGGWVRFEVQDEGPGLTPEDQARVFGAYARLSARPTAGEASVGLGLSIVRRLVEGMGGQIGVDSVPGQGATFWVALPACGDGWLLGGVDA